MCLSSGRLNDWLTVVFVKMTDKGSRMIEVGSLAARDPTPRGQPTSLSGISVPEAYLDVPLSKTGWNYHIRIGWNILQR